MSETGSVPMLPVEYRKRAQSYVKHQILREYLKNAAMIILSAWPDFVFVDGFSGPWKNARDDFADTSFGIAIQELRAARRNWEANGKRPGIRCIFVEKRTDAYHKLQEAVEAVADFEATALHGDFGDHIDEICKIAGRSFTLTFIDPTGWNFDLRKIAPLLRRQPGEVLVNFMYEHFRRFIDDGRPAIRQSQDRAFGGPEWREKYTQLIEAGSSKEEAVLGVFRRQLKRAGDFKFVASTKIRHPLAEKTHFYLVYGTRKLKGLVEFRRAEKAALSVEGAFRSQAKDQAFEERTGQGGLFSDAPELIRTQARVDPRMEDHEKLEARLKSALAKNDWEYERLMSAALERFSISESEFKDMLVRMKREGQVCSPSAPMAQI
ncbi:three-Cys-motif partner protein [Altererythrobacter atlanticus]|uniref:Uncharacterized protein n=1 Tax=Croceibacterium atlanticum TaxID=1267766 RepID=A0A0F7KRJ5_9SPHN|nr:three-Cys-motif partner protein TcmP [Croceibacterium atlanticum]AKH42229.1 hypothetical protein WYH_01184 [Croceibacterium atlanticum]MBB5733958.1 three-Cys-motif partner protein [Croceibacterium atlanticum]